MMATDGRQGSISGVLSDLSAVFDAVDHSELVWKRLHHLFIFFRSPLPITSLQISTVVHTAIERDEPNVKAPVFIVAAVPPLANVFEIGQLKTSRAVGEYKCTDRDGA